MRYTVTTFKVRLEVADVGDRTAASDDAVRIAKPIFAELDADKEHFVPLALNNKNRINGYKVIFTGTLTASLIRPGDIYRAALHLAAAAVVFVHNPPPAIR
jgi:DNA repair protein RadC